MPEKATASSRDERNSSAKKGGSFQFPPFLIPQKPLTFLPVTPKNTSFFREL